MKTMFTILFSLFSTCYITTTPANENFDQVLDLISYEEFSEEFLGCNTSYVGPAAQERATCSASVKLVDNSGYTISMYMASATIPGSSGGSYRDWETDRKSTRLNSSH